MAAPESVVFDWERSIKAIWAERLAPLGARERGDTALPGAWTLAVDAAVSHEWALHSLVPLLQDPHGHRWAVVLGRDDSHPAPNLVFVHGTTPALALARTVALLETGVEAPA